MADRVRVISINGSPRGDRGATAAILNPFLDGMEEAGAEVEQRIWVNRIEMQPCTGCLKCYCNDGECTLKDSVSNERLIQRMAGSDILVIASPVFSHGFTGPLKTLIDRFFVTGQPEVKRRSNGQTYRRRRDWVKHGGKAVLVSSCAAWEVGMFDLILTSMRQFCFDQERELSAALLRPHSQLLSGIRGKPSVIGNLRALVRMVGVDIGSFFKRGHTLSATQSLIGLKKSIGEVKGAAREAGRQLVRDGKISPETLEAVSQPLLPFEAYASLAEMAIGDLQKKARKRGQGLEKRSGERVKNRKI
ncbi:flavodoxin family protein [Candidatus Uhrbacteria bacterium]|nr:flavodoxin family protein [Candidatus Uhrbacteria bacterium]